MKISDSDAPAAPDGHGNTATEKVTPQELRRVAWGTSLGSTLEYFDFSLYTLASSLIFAELFFSDVDPTLGRILSFATLFMGYAARPLGGIVFASYGDRIGRKNILMLTIAIMGASSFLIGVLPTYATIGFWAPVLLVLLRIVQGLGAGAEAAGASTLMTEFAPLGKRGFYSSLQFSGLVGGTALASAVFMGMSAIGEDVLLDWLWRVPFLVSAVLVGVALWLRANVKDSPEFLKMKAQETTIKAPLRSALKSSRKALLIGNGLRIAESAGSSIYKSLGASYVASVALSGRDDATFVVTLSILCASGLGMIVVPLFGWLGDRYGRRTMFRISSAFQILAAVPIWYTLANGNDVGIIIAMSIALGVGVWSGLGLQGATIPELFGVQRRYTGVVLSRELPSVFAGGLAPTIGAMLLAAYTDSWVPLAVLTIAYTACTFLASLFMPETRNRDLSLREDAV
ncbi:MFS transporter [Saccharomonospora sp. NPDC046836]|uniref:MFS transporter n=1 Tax=Saccharomonospora sp. NPDC046836 TaxID=3156921 RepID=UPI0034073463